VLSIPIIHSLESEPNPKQHKQTNKQTNAENDFSLSFLKKEIITKNILLWDGNGGMDRVEV
jgi:hypothetical protein